MPEVWKSILRKGQLSQHHKKIISHVMSSVAKKCWLYLFWGWLFFAVLVMATLRSRCGHYIFILWFLLFFLIWPQLSEIGCLPYFHTWCGLSVNLECRSEMSCTWLAENTGRKSCLKSPSGHHCTILSAISSQLRHISTIGKKLV